MTGDEFGLALVKLVDEARERGLSDEEMTEQVQGILTYINDKDA